MRREDRGQQSQVEAWSVTEGFPREGTPNLGPTSHGDTDQRKKTLVWPGREHVGRTPAL